MNSTQTIDVNSQIRAALGDDGRCWRECEACGGPKSSDYCSTCDGTGEIEDESHPMHPKQTLDGEDETWCLDCDGSGKSKPCPDCDGGRVYDRERLAEAIESFEFPKPVVVRWTGTEPSRRNQFLWAWDNRHDKPWRQSLEDWVHGVRCGCAETDIEVLGVTVKCSPEICADCNGTGWQVEPRTAKAPDYNTPEGMVALKRLLQNAPKALPSDKNNGWMYSVTYLAHTQAFSAKVWKGDSNFHLPSQDFGEWEHEALYRAVTAALGLGENE